MKISSIVVVLFFVLLSACGDTDIVNSNGRFSKGVARELGKFSIIAFDQSFDGGKKLPANFLDIYPIDPDSKTHAVNFLQRNSMFQAYDFTEDDFIDSVKLVFNGRLSREFNKEEFKKQYPNKTEPSEGTELPMFIIVAIEGDIDQFIRNQDRTLSIITRIKDFDEEEDLLHHPYVQPPLRPEAIPDHDIGVNSESWQIHRLSRVENVLQHDDWKTLGLPEKEPGKEYYYLPLYHPVKELDMILTNVHEQNTNRQKSGQRKQGMKSDNPQLASKSFALHERGTRFIPLETPWAIVCDPRGSLGQLCNDRNKMQTLLRELRSTSDFFKRQGYTSSVLRPFYGDELVGPTVYKEAIPGSNPSGLFQMIYITNSYPCSGSPGAVGCYERVFGRLYLLPLFFEQKQSFQKFSAAHEIYHAIQASEYPRLMSGPKVESLFVIEGTADYMGYAAGGWNANSVDDILAVGNRDFRDWSYPLNPRQGFTGKLFLNYENSQFFGQALRLDEIPRVLSSMNTNLPGDSYKALGKAINDVTGFRWTNYLFSNDQDLAGLIGAYIHSTIKNVQQEGYPYCNDNDDFTLNARSTHQEDDPILVRGANTPMSTYCARFNATPLEAPGGDIEFPCVEITIEDKFNKYRPGELNLVVIPDPPGQVHFEQPFGLFHNVQADLSGKALVTTGSIGKLLVVDSDANPIRSATDDRDWEIKMERKASCEIEPVIVPARGNCFEKRWECSSYGCTLQVKTPQCWLNLGTCYHDRACQYKADPNACTYIGLCVRDSSPYE